MGLIKDHYFVYDGVSSLDYGILVAENAVYASPCRVYEKVSVDGRNGDLLFDKNRFSNIEAIFRCVIIDEYKWNMVGMKNFFLSRRGYARLEDTSNPEEYRLACVSVGVDPSTVPRENAGTFELHFDCKPQRYLKSGEYVHTYTDNATIINPSNMDALPLIRVYGTGVISIGNVTLEIKAHGKAYIDIDCEMQDAFYGSINLNKYITLGSGNFPVLKPGLNGIGIGSGITKVELTPRWWRL